MKRNILFLIAAIAVATLVLVFSPVHARADGKGFPTGRYTTSITAEDVAEYGLPSPYPEILIGDWEIIFREDGNYEVANTTTDDTAQGTYLANPSVLVFGKDSGTLACNPPGSAVYKWAASGDTLTFNALGGYSERCWGRYIVFTSHPLVKAP